MSNVQFLFRAPETEVEKARDRQELVDDLHRILNGIADLKTFPETFRYALRDRIWAYPRTLAAGGKVEPMSFRDFVHKRYPEGLGADFATVERLISDEPEIKVLYDREIERGPGAPTGNTNAARHELKQWQVKAAERLKTTVDNMHGCFEGDPVCPRPTGTSEAAGLRRLRKAAEAGDSRAQLFLEDVLSGKTSVHKACLEMGWRKPTVTLRDEPAAIFEAAVQRSTPMETAMRAWRKMSAEDREQFLDWASRNMDL